MGFGKDGKGVIIRESRSQALATLNADIAIFIGTKVAITNDFRMLKAELNITIQGLTAGEGTGLILGLADGDLSTSEIESAILAAGPKDTNDVVTANVAMRPVWFVSLFDENSDATQGTFRGRDGEAPIMHKARWTFSETKSWNWFIFNRSASSLTTGAIVRMTNKVYGVWVR